MEKTIKHNLILFRLLRKTLVNIFKSNYYGFIRGHDYINSDVIGDLKNFIINDDHSQVKIFEKEFSKIIGKGSSLSFAAGRMGFYLLMKSLKIGEGDEVILNSGNCSVMVNAVIRVGAKPIYSDVDPETFGSCPKKIEKAITRKTKLIVAQHSFGIPCKINKIVKISNEKNIFLLEDCALSLDSLFNGIKIGNFGDAALFSFDHSKPVNSYIGGMLYSNEELIEKLRNNNESINKISVSKQFSILRRIKVERVFYNVKKYKFSNIINIIYSILIKMKISNPYLNDDFGIESIEKTYPYPSKMPLFISKLAQIEFKNWEKLKDLRLMNFQLLLNYFNKSKLKHCIPRIYYNEDIEIIPLRFILYGEGLVDYKKKWGTFLDIDSIWFESPIIATKNELLDFDYNIGECPISEKIGKHIINLPLCYDIKSTKNLINLIDKTLN